jgi:hypothetical protein
MKALKLQISKIKFQTSLKLDLKFAMKNVSIKNKCFLLLYNITRIIKRIFAASIEGLQIPSEICFIIK